MALLDRIRTPADLKGLSLDELVALSDEIRQYIIEVVSVRGGHLASSLGAVEIALALHYVFDSPRDKILWDVGHQSYAHKILTGRREAFKSLRTRGGLSGFPNTAESEHDAFGVGHASTSISAALGIAVSRDLLGGDQYVISVVGDGAISGGLSFEGINQAGHLKKNRFIIILNDNEMSISRNVGALARYLTRITTKRVYLRFEADVWELLGKVPRYGLKARKVVRRMKESIKNLLVPTILFEELGFRYFGPFDGHDLAQLVSAFSQIRDVPGPVIVHVMTKKGKGYSFAEENAEKFHGIGSFYKATGDSKSNGTRATYSEVFGAALVELAGRDTSVVAVTAAMKEGTGLAPFARAFPERFFDVGIAEQHAVTFAAGLARSGLKPFVAIYSTFLQRGFDQIIHDVALQRLGVRFVLDRAGLVGEDGPTHHGSFDLSYLRLVPGMVVMAPRDDEELRRMMLTALDYGAGPIAMRFPRGDAAVGSPDPRRIAVPIGKGEVLRRGVDATLVGVGSMVGTALAASEILCRSGISASVIDAKFVKPLDSDLLASFGGEGSPIVFALEENSRCGGFGDAVLELFSDRAPGTRVVTIGLPDHFVPHGKRDELLDEIGISAQAVAAEVARIAHSRGKSDHGGSR
ncbi:MAG: 1-deoxy-D-xylulose-5-phosphate synthase [Candidatus Krumholzibacteria bacterium]|nr:1-deoxy-D-xylulose-5-phosphate synthase [Candidatus Krumholzibacteria bacterium]